MELVIFAEDKRTKFGKCERGVFCINNDAFFGTVIDYI